MFDWFYELLFQLSITIFRLIDGLILCANKLCGIETINFKGEEKDFLSYLLFSDEIGFAFRVTSVLATILLVIFTVFMIIRSIVKDKAEGTPAQIAVKAFKTLLIFFLVPLVMVAFMTIGNAFVTALYSATIQNSASPGAFLFSAFAEDGGMPAELAEKFRTRAEGYDYTNVDQVAACMDISNFPFFFSWLAGGIVLFGVGSAMLVFVDRVLSIVILYIASPISISTSVLDDGARFKLWRDQFLSKFIMGYGMIIAINIYALVCGLVMDSELTFFADNSFLNLIMKLLIIGGGALTMQKSMALIGNLVSQGAGSNELRDTMSAGAIARMAKGAAGSALSAAGLPIKPITSILSDAAAMKSRDIGASWLKKLGLGLSGGTADEKGVKDPSGSSESQNNEKPSYGTDNNKTKDAINNPGFTVTDWSNSKNQNSGNANTNKVDQKKDNAVNKAISNNDKESQAKKAQGQNEGEGDNK